jgi:GNAT superfamily N-acetyltransferase
MKDPRRTQQLQGLGRLIESTGIPYTAESLSYDPSGRGLFTGAGGLGGTTRMRPQALEAAMNLAPFVGPANRGLMQATKGLPVGASIKSIDDIFAKYPNVIIDASVGKKDINLSRIVVPKEMRNQGIGTQVMNDLSEYADGIGKRITLTPSGDFGGSVPKLKTFYKELGFVENKGKNKDFSTRETMYREPKEGASIYPQQAALETAQRNAALPVEQGGLGLPPNNTAEMRAQAMGGMDAVHFSRQGGDYSTLDSGKFAIAPFDAVGTHVGSPQAAMERFQNTVGYKVGNPNYALDELKGTSYPVKVLGDKPLLNQNGMPWGEDDLNTFLRKTGGHNYSDINGGKLTYQDLNADLRKKLFDEQGYTSIPYFNEVEGKGSISYIVPPENIRSRFAAFDPMRRSAAIAAAMGLAAPDLLANQAPVNPIYQDPFVDTTR